MLTCSLFVSIVTVKLNMEGRYEEDVPSRNAVAEIRGSEYPEEVVVMGGHIDSWDVGQGAMDDGGGCVAAWQAVKLMKDLGLTPPNIWCLEKALATMAVMAYVVADMDEKLPRKADQ